MSVGDALAEPLKIYEPSLSVPAREARIVEMLERVGLSAGMAHRYPHEFSGGQCQRIGIARAMMLRPKLLVCDEPVSSLDVSIQGQIVNLLVDLQRELGTAMLFISHNLAVVRHLSHRVLVIYRGRLVEVADRDELFAAPAHPYTRALLAAVPDPAGPRPARAQPGEALTRGDEPPTGDEPLAAPRTPGGCAFHERCAYAQASCLLSVPPLQEIASQHFAACHRWREVVYSSRHETR
jgi:oligopeptide transport system ATP-binding protein